MLWKNFLLRIVKVYQSLGNVVAMTGGGVTIAAYMAGSRTSEPAARTRTFATMIFSQFTMIFSIRSGNKPFIHRFFSNRWLWMTIVFVIGLSFGVLILSEIFKLVSTCSNSSAGKL